MSIGAVKPVPVPRDTSEFFGWLQCSLCDRWRRVTADGLRTWGTSFHERHFQRCKELLRSDVLLDGVIADRLGFDDLVRVVRAWVDTQAELLCKHSVLLCALAVLEEQGELRFAEERADLEAAYPGAKFVCADLVEGDCREQSDTDVFLQDLSANHATWKGRPVLCLDVVADEISFGVVRTCMTHSEKHTTSCDACATGRKFYKAAPLHARNQHDIVDVGPLCEAHFQKLFYAGKKCRCKRLTVSEAEELVRVAAVPGADEVVLTVDVAQQTAPAKFVLRQDGAWLARDTARVFRISLEESVPLRQPKAQVEFNLDMLHRVRDCHKVLGNAVLFKCNTCNNRFVTWHPDHKPSVELDVRKGYSNEVRTWEVGPTDDGTRQAFLAQASASVARCPCSR
jgi:hypothetical protein